MCGIIGKVGRQAQIQSLDVSHLDSIKHRGPDDQGIYNEAHIGLGHVRLSILDLSAAGHQPMHSPDGRYTIVYNGEVYNYLEVRDRLRAEGVVFTTQCDTEVVLKAYIHLGPTCLDSFRGMFSFAIWDKKDRCLFIARDRCGEKPFIYFMGQDSFCFSSEFKGLVPLLPDMPRLNPDVVDMYLHYQYTPEPYTLLEGVHKLPAAHYAVLDVARWSLVVRKYWDLTAVDADASLTKQDLRDELETSVQLCMRSDVQIGVALSAGIDSAGITAIARKYYQEPLEAFCVGYPGRPAYDERFEAKHLADLLGCHFNEVELGTEKFVDAFGDFAMLLDEPVADIAAFGHYTVPKLCADKGIKVLLTGIGGDELFWGYDWSRATVSANQHAYLFSTLQKLLGPAMNIQMVYKILSRLSRTTKIPEGFRAFCRQLLAHIDYNGPADQLIFMSASGAPEFSKKYAVGKGWYGPAMTSIDPYNAYVPTQLDGSVAHDDVPIEIMDLLFKTWMTSNCLSLGDRVSMAVGVETRLPFLDVGVIEKVVAWRKCNPDHSHGQKAVLRDILSDILPPETIKRRKSGFVPPVTKWLKGVADLYASNLDQGHLVTQGIIMPYLTKSIDHLALNPHTLYRLTLLEQWYDGMHKLYGQSIRNQNNLDHENRILFG